MRISGQHRFRTVGDLEAVSQNLMHSSLVLTDGIYGELAQDESAERIATFAAKDNGKRDMSEGEVKEQLEAILSQLKTASENGLEK